MLRGLARGAVLGLVWGIVLRLAMRLFATNPEFSWAGTVAIIGMAVVLGALIGLVRSARAATRSPWWRLAPLPGLLLFLSPGMVLLPGILGVAAARSQSSRRFGPLLGVAGLATTTVGALTLDDGERTGTPLVAWLGIVLFLAVTISMGWSVHGWWRRWGQRSNSARRDPATAAGQATTTASSTAYG